MSELRAPAEFRSLMRSEVFASPPRAAVAGQPVLLIPPFLASDRSMAPLAGWLRRGGYAPKRAGIAFNADCSQAESVRLERRLSRAVSEAGRPALIVGHSRGGLFARVLAVRRPELVAGIVTLGSPLVDAGRNVTPLLGVPASVIALLGDLRVPGLFSNDCGDARMFTNGPVDRIGRLVSRRARARVAENEGRETCCTPFWRDYYSDFPADVHFVSLWSRDDGVVSPRATRSPGSRTVEVSSTHIGMAGNASTYEALARELPAMASRPAV